MKRNGRPFAASAEAGRWLVLRGTWGEKERFEIEMKAECSLSTHVRTHAVTVDRGPLSYSLELGERFRDVPAPTFETAADGTSVGVFPAEKEGAAGERMTEVLPVRDWNYALVRTNLSTGIVGVHPPKVSGVVFDFGGVMTTTTMPERVRRYTDRFGIDWRHLERGFARYRRLLDGGFMTIEQMYDLIWADADVTLPDEAKARILEEDFASFLENYRNLKTLAWMKALKASGRKVGILTNMPPEFAVRFRKVFADFIAVADAMVISGDERMFKPQRRIYDLLASRIGLKPENLCFVDDVESNCEGARRAGWKAIRFEDNEQVERDFGILVG